MEGKRLASQRTFGPLSFREQNDAVKRTTPAFASAITLERFCDACQGIEADLRNVSSECRKKYPDIHLFAKRGVERISSYGAQREFLFRKEKNEAPLSTSGSPHTSLAFPTWDILLVLGALTHEHHAPNLHKPKLWVLSAAQRLISLWQQQYQASLHCEKTEVCSTSPKPLYSTFRSDVFLTNEQLDILLHLLLELAGISFSRQIRSANEAACLSTKDAHSIWNLFLETPNQTVLLSPSNGGQAKTPAALLDKEQLELKILQLVLSLFSVNTPLFCCSPFLEGERTEQSEVNSTSFDVPSATLRAHRLFALLAFLYSVSSAETVIRAARAGLSQYIRFLLDSYLFLELPEPTELDINAFPTPNSLVKDKPLSPIIDSFFVKLCTVAGLNVSTEFTPSETLQEAIEPTGIRRYSDPDIMLALELLVSALDTAPFLYRENASLCFMIEKYIHPLLCCTLSDPSKSASVLQRRLQLAYVYLTVVNQRTNRVHCDKSHHSTAHDDALFSSQRDVCAPPTYSLDNVVLSLVTLCLESPADNMQHLLGCRFFQALFFCPNILSCLTPETLVEIVGALIRTIHELCFNARESEEHNLGVNGLSDAASTAAEPSYSLYGREKLLRSWCCPLIRVPFPILADVSLCNSDVKEKNESSFRSLFPWVTEILWANQTAVLKASCCSSTALKDTPFLSPLTSTSIVEEPVAQSSGERHCSFELSTVDKNAEAFSSNTFTAPDPSSLFSCVPESLITAGHDGLSFTTLLDHALKCLAAVVFSFLYSVYLSIDTSVALTELQPISPFLLLPHIPQLSIIKSSGRVYYAPFPRPLTQAQAATEARLDSIWATVLSGLSTVMTLENSFLTPLFGLITDIFASLITVLSLYQNTAAFRAALCTLARYACCQPQPSCFKAPHGSQATTSVSQNENHRVSEDLGSLTNICLDGFKRPVPWLILDSNRFLCWKCLLYVGQHLATTLDASLWCIVLGSLEYLNATISVAAAEPPGLFCFPSVLDLAFSSVENGSSHVRSPSIGPSPQQHTSPTGESSVKNKTWMHSPKRTLSLLDEALCRVFQCSAQSCLTQDSVRQMLYCFARRLVQLAGEPLLKGPPKTRASENDDALGTLVCELNNAEIAQAVAAIGGVEHTLAARLVDVDISVLTSLGPACVVATSSNGAKKQNIKQQQHLLGLQMKFCVSQFITVVLKNLERLTSIADITWICETLGVVASGSSDRLASNQCQLLAVESLQRLMCSLVELTFLPTQNTTTAAHHDAVPNGCTEMTSHFNTLGKSNASKNTELTPCCLSITQGVALAQCLDIFVKTSDVDVKRAVLENVSNVISISGSRLLCVLPWTVLSLFLIICTAQSCDFHETLPVMQLACSEQPRSLRPSISRVNDGVHRGLSQCVPLRSWGQGQDNLLFKLFDVLVLEYRDYLLDPTAVTLLASSISAVASSNECGDNVSFAAVGLLWTLGDALARRSSPASRHETHFNACNDEQCSAVLCSETSCPSSVAVIVNFQKKQALITLTPHPSRSFSRQLDLVVMTIFNQFRHLALDPRIEVRNCSLHSVVSAYRSAAQHARLDQDIFTKGVGEILIATLSDVSYAYKTLVETSGVVLQQSSDSYTSDAGLQHHSRDTALKLWDESLTILFDGVLVVITDLLAIPNLDSGSLHLNPFYTLLDSAVTAARVLPEFILLDPSITFSKKGPSVDAMATTLCFTLTMASKGVNSADNENGFCKIFWDILENFVFRLPKINFLPSRIVDMLIDKVRNLASLISMQLGSCKSDVVPRYFCICFQALLTLATMASYTGKEQWHKSGHSVDRPDRLTTRPIIADASDKNFDLRRLVCSNWFKLKLIDTVAAQDDCADTEGKAYKVSSVAEALLDRVSDRLFCENNALMLDAWLSEDPYLSSKSTSTSPFGVAGASDWSWRTEDFIFSESEKLRCQPSASHSLFAWRGSSSLSNFVSSSRSRSKNLFNINNNTAPSTELASDKFFTLVSTLTRLGLNAKDANIVVDAFEFTTTSCTSPPPVAARTVSVHHGGTSTGPPSATPYDDDYQQAPSWLTAQPSNMDDDMTRAIFDAKKATRIRRRQHLAQRPFFIVDTCFEAIEGHLPWGQLLLKHPLLWAQCIDQFLTSLLYPRHIYAHTGCLVLAARGINSVTRILRQSFVILTSSSPPTESWHAAAAAVYLLAFYLLKLICYQSAEVSAEPSSHLELRSFATEALLQLGLDAVSLMHRHHHILSQDFYASTSSTNVLHSTVLVIITMIYRLWSEGLSWRFLAPTAKGNGKEQLDDLVVLLLRCALGIHASDGTRMRSLPAFFCATLSEFLDQLAVAGSRFGSSHNLSHMCLVTMFDVCHYLSFQATPSSPAELCRLRFVNYCLYQRLRDLFTRFAVDDTQSGQCPLPQHRLEELMLALERLQNLRVCPEAIMMIDRLKTKDLQTVGEELFASPTTATQNVLDPASSVIHTTQYSHIFLLLPELIQLVATKNGVVRKKLIGVLQQIVPAVLPPHMYLIDATSTFSTP